MTIASTTTKVSYAGNGSTTAFALPFLFFKEEDIQAVLRGADGAEADLSPGTDYTLSGAGESSGGLATLATAPAQGEVLVLRRDPAMVQEVDYVENDAFPAATHEAALDLLTMICQSLAEKLGRAVTFQITSALDGVHMPEPEADKVLAWNGAGDGLANVELAASGLLALPLAVAQGGTGATTQSAAQSALGLLVGTDVQAHDPDTAKTDTAQQWTAAQTCARQALAIDSGSVAWDLSSAQSAVLTLTGNATLANPGSQQAGGTYQLMVVQDATGGRTLDFGTAYKWPGGEAPTITADADAVDILTFVSDGTSLYGAAVQDLS